MLDPSHRGLWRQPRCLPRRQYRFRHPDTVSHLISLSGSFDISSFFDGYHDDNIYFNSPYEYLPNITDPWKYNHMGIIIGTGEWDNTRHESYRLSEILNSKGIRHW